MTAQLAALLLALIAAAMIAGGCYTPGANDPSATDIHDAADTHLAPGMRNSLTNSVDGGQHAD